MVFLSFTFFSTSDEIPGRRQGRQQRAGPTPTPTSRQPTGRASAHSGRPSQQRRTASAFLFPSLSFFLSLCRFSSFLNPTTTTTTTTSDIHFFDCRTSVKGGTKKNPRKNSLPWPSVEGRTKKNKERKKENTKRKKNTVS